MSATTTKSRGARFLLTRIVTGGAAVAIFVSLWAGVAATAASKTTTTTSASAPGSAADDSPIVQDGWRWDKATQQWVSIEQPAAVTAAVQQPAPQPVVVIERQPVYYTTYVQQVPQGQGAVAAQAGNAASTATATGASRGTAATPGTTAAPAASPAPAAALPAFDPAGSTPAGIPSIPFSPAAPGPAAPAAPAPAPAPAAPAAPPPAPAAAPPAPKPAAPPPAPKTTRAS